jgi:hypothetical protein
MAREQANDLQLWKLLEGREIESGLGEEALEQAGLVLLTWVTFWLWRVSRGCRSAVFLFARAELAH